MSYTYVAFRFAWMIRLLLCRCGRQCYETRLDGRQWFREFVDEDVYLERFGIYG